MEEQYSTGCTDGCSYPVSSVSPFLTYRKVFLERTRLTLGLRGAWKRVYVDTATTAFQESASPDPATRGLQG